MINVAEVGPLQFGAWQPCKTLMPCGRLTRHYHRPEKKVKNGFKGGKQTPADISFQI